MMKKTVFSLGVLILLGISIVQLLIYDFTFSNKKFVSQEWIEGDTRNRGEMARNLKETNLLNNKAEKFVILLLGVPDERQELKTDLDRRVNLYYMIDIGYKFGGKVWNYTLTISLKDGVVEHYYLAD